MAPAFGRWQNHAMTIVDRQPSRVNPAGIISLLLGLVGIGLTFGNPWTLPPVIALVAGLIVGIVAVTRASREKVTGIIGIIISALPIAISLVMIVALASRR